jgi:hypothetical protein
MLEVILLTTFITIGIGSWLVIMFKLFRNVIRRLKEKKDI